MKGANKDFFGETPTWCSGCGDFPIRMGLASALTQLGHDPSSVFIIFGIGCSGNMNDFLNAYAMHPLHGRSVANAVGAKLANHKMPVIVVAGDGDCYGEGGNHLLHALRGNHDITVIVHDNRVYGLTTGQVAPTAKEGDISKSTPAGIIERPVNPLTLGITQGASYVAQGFSGELAQLTDLIRGGIEHKGFSLINILQPCVTFNRVSTYQYYLKNAYKLPENYNPDDHDMALLKACELDREKFPLGVIYKTDKPSYHARVAELEGKDSLISRERFTDFDGIISQFV